MELLYLHSGLSWSTGGSNLITIFQVRSKREPLPYVLRIKICAMDWMIVSPQFCSHEIKRCLLLGRKVMPNLDSILKCRDITLPTNVCLVKALVFPVVMYRCENWTIKKAEHWRIMLLNCGVGEDSWESLGQQRDPTSLSWRKLVLNIHWKDWCWSWNSNTLATWCEELTNIKDPDAGKDWRWEEKGTTEDEMAGWHHWLNRHEFE